MFMDVCGLRSPRFLRFGISCLLRCLYSDTEGIRELGSAPSRRRRLYIYGVRAMRDEAPLTALAGPPADTQSYSSVG